MAVRERRGMHERRSDLAPDREAQLLLTAALDEQGTGLAAWETWKREYGSLDELPGALAEILPRIFIGLQDRLDDGPVERRLAGVARHAWTRNRVAAHALAPLLDAYATLGIPAIALGALASAIGTPNGLTTRRIDEAELLVPSTHLEQAGSLARKQGFRSIAPTAAARRRGTSVRLASGDAVVHLRSAPVALPWAGDQAWELARAAELDGAPVRVAAHEHEVVHACVAATLSPTNDPMWLLDSAVGISSTGRATSTGGGRAIDWGRVAEYARAERVRFPLAAALEVLASATKVELPAGLPEQLRRPRPGLPERFIHRLIAGPPRIRRLRWYAHLYWNERERASA